MAVVNISKIVYIAPISEPILIRRYISITGIIIINNKYDTYVNEK